MLGENDFRKQKRALSTTRDEHNLPIRLEIDTYTTLDYLDTLARREKKARDLLTAPLWSLLSQLSIVTECQKQISLWKKSAEVAPLLRQAKSESDVTRFNDFFQKWAR